MDNTIFILGDGIAAITAIKTIRATDLDSEIYLVGEEKFYPYIRLRLSKGIFDDLEENNILIQKKEWYEQNRIHTFIGIKAINVCTSSQEVLLSDGSKFKYDKLLFANGASNTNPKIEGIALEGVYTLRSLKDAFNIKKSLDKSEEIVVIGGGILGLEMAWGLHKHGKKVIVIELQSRLMPRQLDEKASEILKNIIQDCGIEILTNTGVNKIIGNTKVEGILIDEKMELKCDMVIYSIGIKPNLDLTVNTEIETLKGILVNNKMETNIKNIYAAGDIAEYDAQVIGLWNIAIAQGKVAGYNLIGKESIYEKVTPVTLLNAFAISLFSMGTIDESKATKVLIDEDIAAKKYKKIFIKDNMIIGAVVIGDTKKSPLLKSAIENGIVLDGVDLANISVEELLDTF